MGTNSPLPQQLGFYFRVDEIRERPQRSSRVRQLPRRQDDEGNWLPPRALGWSRIVTNTHGMFYLYSPASQHVLSVLSIPRDTGEPPNAHLHHTFSLYHNRGIIYTVPFDATNHQVGDGSHTKPSDEEESGSDSGSSTNSQQTADWAEVSFHPQPRQLGRPLSYVTYGAHEPRLCFSHRGQEAWITQLLPDRYHAGNLSFAHLSSGNGGLIGDLGLIIGLIALSVEADRVQDTLTHCLRSQLPWQPGGIRARGYRDRRGVVVHIYACMVPVPGQTQMANTPPRRQSNDNLLQNLERGVYGAIFDWIHPHIIERTTHATPNHHTSSSRR